MNTTFTTTNYEAIATNIANQLPESNESFDIEILFDGYTVYASGFYEVEYRECVGGSYEGYAFERYTETVSKRVELAEVVAIEQETDEATELNIQTIESLLN